MIFLTVGTQFAFDRLVEAVDRALDDIPDVDEVFAQVGQTRYRPRNFKAVPSLDKHEFDERCRAASSIIGHAGMGTISMALELNKPLLVLPRRKKFGEVVNDHQVAIARKFEQLGHLLVAYEADELPAKLKLLPTFVPRPRQAQPQAVAERIASFLRDLSTSKSTSKRGVVQAGNAVSSGKRQI